eukprot:jgi/Hompol1/3355/HPOL_006537-RA
MLLARAEFQPQTQTQTDGPEGVAGAGASGGDAEVDAQLDAAAACLVNADSFASAQVCWSDFKRDKALAVLARLQSMSYFKTIKFSRVL